MLQWWMVDYVHIFDESDPSRFSRRSGPTSTSMGPNTARTVERTVRKAGGKVHIVGWLPGCHIVIEVQASAAGAASSSTREVARVAVHRPGRRGADVRVPDGLLIPQMTR